MLRRIALLTTRRLTQFFQLPTRLAYLGGFLLAQPFAWSDIEELESKELDTFVIVGMKDEALELEQSAAAVDVIDLKADQKLTADLSEVLSREPGISIRRMGGLGSRERFSLNGLRDEQIRFFIDGIPLEMSGYTFGLSTIPVNLVQRADIYHGVVPVEFGADALGGAVNFITDRGADGTGGSVSHMVGDFNTSRSTLYLNYAGNKGFFSRLNGFYDYSDNNYEVDATLPTRLGKTVPYKAKRFHDAYEGQGINLDFGYTEKSWAELFQIGLYSSEYHKDIQHNVSMSKPYGEARVERKSYGFNLKYNKQLTEQISFTATGGRSEIKTYFIDIGENYYLWNGEARAEAVPTAGEMDAACQCSYWRNNQYTSVHLGWSISEGHTIDLSTSATKHSQSSENHFLASELADPVDADRDMLSWVSGINYTFEFLNDQLQNQFFVKRYSQDRESDQLNESTGLKENLESSYERAGWGNLVRYKFYDWLLGKASYEKASRLPSFVEVFGNAESINANLELKAEYSDNYNLSLEIDGINNDYGFWKASSNFFIRDIKDAIVLMVQNDFSVYENISAADSRGFQVSGTWTSLEDFLNLAVNYTEFDLINKADIGRFSQFKNDRVANHPYKFINTKLGIKWINLLTSYDEVEVNWNYRFVGEFELMPEGYVSSQSKIIIPTQESQSLAVTYTKDIYSSTVSVSAEVQNLTDQKLYDHYGVQRPGRAFNVKTIIEF